MNKIRNFKEDLNNSNNPELRKEWERIFRLKFGNDCEILYQDNLSIQKGLGTDITIKTKKGRRYSIELKTRNFRCYKDPFYIMEIVHQTYNNPNKDIFLFKKEGWIYTTTAEYIFHATLDESGKKIKEVIFYSLIPFKNESWKSEFDKYGNLWLSTLFDNFQLTLNKKIPKEVIKKDALEFWEWSENVNAN
jgi:hypothetical protein